MSTNAVKGKSMIAAPLRTAQLVVGCSSTCWEPYQILSLSSTLANGNTVISRTKLLMFLFFVLKAESLCCILWFGFLKVRWLV